MDADLHPPAPEVFVPAFAAWPAAAQSHTALGIGTGVVAGALVAGPVGAVIGGFAGAIPHLLISLSLGSSGRGQRLRVRLPLSWQARSLPPQTIP